MLRTVLLLDGSEAININNDYLPSYLLAIRRPLLDFVAYYLNSTPLASLSAVVMRDGVSRRLTPLTTNYTELEAVLEKMYFLYGGSGSLSLVNGLRMALSELVDVKKIAAATEAASKSAPLNQKGSVRPLAPQTAAQRAQKRHIILFSAAVTVIDAVDVFRTIQTVAACDVVVSVVSFAGAVHVYESCAVATGGTLHCPLSYDHFLRLLRPLALEAGQARRHATRRKRARGEPGDEEEAAEALPELIPVGFPVYVSGRHDPRVQYLACPQCHLPQSAIPSTCPLCQLLLCNVAYLYNTITAHNHFLPPAITTTATTTGGLQGEKSAAAAGDTGDSGSNKNKSEKLTTEPRRCDLCCVYLHRSRSGGGGETAEHGEEVYTCSKCRSHRCRTCQRFVEEKLGLCPLCIALQ